MRRLGDLESAIMEVLWSTREAATVRQVLNALGRDPEPAYTTIMTVLDNLHRKDMVTRERTGRAWAYLPAQSREDFAAETMAEVLDASADRSTTLLRFIGKISPEEQARLLQMIYRKGEPS
jgi:predicted transcriptional regulator